jgi:hypothetical protein
MTSSMHRALTFILRCASRGSRGRALLSARTAGQAAPSSGARAIAFVAEWIGVRWNVGAERLKGGDGLDLSPSFWHESILSAAAAQVAEVNRLLPVRSRPRSASASRSISGRPPASPDAMSSLQAPARRTTGTLSERGCRRRVSALSLSLAPIAAASSRPGAWAPCGGKQKQAHRSARGSRRREVIAFDARARTRGNCRLAARRDLGSCVRR